VDALLLEVVEFDREDGRRAGEIRAALANAGTPIGPYDALIAGQLVARELTLVTANVEEFRRVGGLVVEDWSRPSSRPSAPV
jgi:tRNA(fMet)-specific endonuclease VapC